MNAKSYSAPFCSDEVENERSAACTYAYYVYGSAAAETASPHSLLRHPLSAMPYRARRVLVTALFILDSRARAPPLLFPDISLAPISMNERLATPSRFVHLALFWPYDYGVFSNGTKTTTFRFNAAMDPWTPAGLQLLQARQKAGRGGKCPLGTFHPVHSILERGGYATLQRVSMAFEFGGRGRRFIFWPPTSTTTTTSCKCKLRISPSLFALARVVPRPAANVVARGQGRRPNQRGQQPTCESAEWIASHATRLTLRKCNDR